MKFGKLSGILFFFVLVVSTLFATVSEKPRQGLVSIFGDLQPASEPSETLSNAGDQTPDTVTPRQTNQFTGRRWDGFSAQYFHRNRYMNPKYGRFTSRDPIGFEKESNLYRYALNNPLIYTDPFGTFPVTGNIARWIWRMGAEHYLRPRGYNFAAHLLEHSLQDYPSILYFRESDQYSMQIKSSETLKRTIFENVVLPAQPGYHLISRENVGVNFTSGDLFLAIHLGNLDFEGSICKNSDAQYSVDLRYLIVHDRYDFDFVSHGYIYQQTIPYLAANLAALDQITGAIVPYKWFANVGHYVFSQ